MTAIRDSGLNLNPQQEGFTIYVPIPKVTREHREHLAEGAKKKLNEFKADLRKVQTSAQRRVGEDELADKITKEDAKSAQETIKLIADHFQAQGEIMLVNKTKELLGK
ncbi:ribosome-recycling factor, mitochondrial [Eurytemora carolleeae]|uniref:ribosome-recycling factor, mitochondrial n=1 Tax=Eurytemora carolleeae TaxID=1294199 RepID=UPI000C778DCE|nr:ribosome-recycling factor, mitochondrial [Eurytemora carolleeae]|eukprot:XP_023343360.1 ribosome-recycling factor, mitochondrial-like [Eurytemora affinis]